ALPSARPAELVVAGRSLAAKGVEKTVMPGLLPCWVGSGAIATAKIFPPAPPRRAMDRFEQAFWSGQSIEELYRALSAKPTQSMAACFVAAMREWKRSFESHSRSIAGLQARIEKVMNVSIAREVERLERRVQVLRAGGAAGPLVGVSGGRLGDISCIRTLLGAQQTHPLA